jgi:hypothetical protein
LAIAAPFITIRAQAVQEKMRMDSTTAASEHKQTRQAIAGVVPPELGEAMIRQVLPSVTVAPGMATLCEKMMRTIVLAPFAWMILALPYFKKIMPGTAKRYTLTNRRLMVRTGWKMKPTQEVALADIDDVRVAEGSYSHFYRSGTLEVVSKGQVALSLHGVPEPESFRRAVVNAKMAWAPKK